MNPSDDLGHPWHRASPATRVVSLVPSLTEAVASVDRGALVGATEWCIEPADLDVVRVRGTKNPDVDAIIALEPDVVLAAQEENRRIDVERLRGRGVPVWVTSIESLDEAFVSLRRMFELALGWPVPGWVGAAESRWAAAQPEASTRHTCVVPIWRDPWMVVGSQTFAADLLARLGFDNLYAGRYPSVTVAEIVALAPDVVVLPDEPYRFTAQDGLEAFPGLTTALVDGRALTWYGPSLVTARGILAGALARALGAGPGRLDGRP